MKGEKMITLYGRDKSVLYQSDAKTTREAVQAAISAEVVLHGADLRKANLRKANLHGADLRKANLCGADLRKANLCGANLPDNNVCLHGSRHEIIAIDNDVQIGCHRKPLAEWLEEYKAIGQAENYTPAEIVEYGLHLRHIQALIDLKGKK